MPIEILMPALSPTMTEGNLASWSVKEGDTIQSGDILCEIETDKATMEVEAVEEGVLGKILILGGTQGVPVNSLIALMLEEDEDASVLDNYEPSPTTTSSSDPTVTEATPASTPPASTPPASTPPASTPPAPAAPAPAAPKSGSRIIASPLARRIAADKGLDLANITGSGPRGRIVKRDVEGAQPQPAASPAASLAASPAASPVTLPESGSYTAIPHSTIRKVIARRLQESKQTVPHFYLTADCRIDKLLDMRKALNAASPEGEGAYKISVNDFVVKAVAKALQDVPEANAQWTEDAVLLMNGVDISIAVATPSGLITPIVRNADFKGLNAISADVKDLAKRARDGKLMPEEYTGGGFTISNLGMYGVKDFAAIINPPQSCILAVGAGEPRPIVVNGELAVGTVMTCTLSVDHRSVDGAVGAQFLAAFKRNIEEPAFLAL
ncbi:MAG: pyruvate dehydrogenase complex dihydrolipoamide acetyltransferase [Magnetovibrio sp.]|nr:pyruvate dehydrogenase complex dihydrolipoamide acetyltransferase [Magnetovibrio sp.]